MTAVPFATFLATPWGVPDSVEAIAPGILWVTTPSHGGFILDEDRNALVPESWRAATWNRQGERGFYEEDCDSWLVLLAFPEAAGADDLRAQRLQTAEHMFSTYWTRKKGLRRHP